MNANLFTFSSYQKHFNNMSQIVKTLEKLDDEVSGTNFANLRAFNHTYLIITRNVMRKLGTGFFSNDVTMQKLDINFAQYYFDALHNYVRVAKVPPLWQKLFNGVTQNKHFQFIYMAMGVDAHVNNDLALSLFAIKPNAAFKNDFDKINMIIMDSLREVVISLQEDVGLLEYGKNNFLIIYAPVLSIIIRRWRENAWHTYQPRGL